MRIRRTPPRTPERNAVCAGPQGNSNETGREHEKESKTNLVAEQIVLPVPDVEQRDREEEVGPVGPAAQVGGQTHEAQAQGRDHCDLQQHAGAEVVREPEQGVVEKPRAAAGGARRAGPRSTVRRALSRARRRRIPTRPRPGRLARKRKRVQPPRVSSPPTRQQENPDAACRRGRADCKFDSSLPQPERRVSGESIWSSGGSNWTGGTPARRR